MAHLVRCRCGKKYRCERDHRSPPGVIHCLEDERHGPCPDEVLHGTLSVSFERITMPKILGLDEWPSLTDLFRSENG